MGCGRKRDDSVDITVRERDSKIYVAKSFSIGVIDWIHVARLYIPYILTASLVFAIACLLPPAQTLAAVTDNPQPHVEYVTATVAVAYAHVSSVWYAYAIILACVYYGIKSKPSVYLMDFTVFESPKDWQVTRAEIIEIMRRHNCYDESSLDFMSRLLERSGTGEATHWPPGTVKLIRPDVSPAVFVTQREKDAAAAAETSSTAAATASSSTSVRTKAVPVVPSASGVSRRGASAPESSSSRKTSSAAVEDPVSSAASSTSSPTDAAMPSNAIAVPDRSMGAARAVAETVLCKCFEDLLVRTRVKTRDIDFLIINCSLFCPTPSLTSIVARRFGLKPTVRTYNLGGMGCSASVIAIDLAKQLLQNRSNSIAVVLSTEEITQCMYLGNQKAMLLQNTLFRVGGSAMLLSNKLADGFRAKYKLLHTVRVQDLSERAMNAVYQCEDAAGVRGISLSKDITDVAGSALKNNLTILGPQILPIREQAKVLWSMAKRKLIPVINSAADAVGMRNIPGTAGNETPGRLTKTPIYVPDFKRAINHFCIHAGGRAVIDGIEANLKLEKYHTAPSRATLYHWGNTSSSSIWYELRYCEGENDRGGKSVDSPAPSSSSSSASSGTATTNDGIPVDWDPTQKWALPEYRGRHVRPGERVLQIAFGSGFKCNSAVWLRMR